MVFFKIIVPGSRRSVAISIAGEHEAVPDVQEDNQVADGSVDDPEEGT